MKKIQDDLLANKVFNYIILFSCLKLVICLSSIAEITFVLTIWKSDFLNLTHL